MYRYKIKKTNKELLHSLRLLADRLKDWTLCSYKDMIEYSELTVDVIACMIKYKGISKRHHSNKNYEYRFECKVPPNMQTVKTIRRWYDQYKINLYDKQTKKVRERLIVMGDEFEDRDPLMADIKEPPTFEDLESGKSFTIEERIKEKDLSNELKKAVESLINIIEKKVKQELIGKLNS